MLFPFVSNTPKPVIAQTIVQTGQISGRKAYGRYESVGTPSTPAVYIAAADHGTRKEKIVPPSSRVLERTYGAI